MGKAGQSGEKFLLVVWKDFITNLSSLAFLEVRFCLSELVELFGSSRVIKRCSNLNNVNLLHGSQGYNLVL